MIRVSLIGPGNIDFHYKEVLKLREKKITSQIEKIARALANSNVEIVLVPNKGISFEIAKKYKEFNGKKVIGTVPASDKRYGIKHLEPFIKTQVNGRNLFDEFINTQDWRDENRMKGLMGDVVLYLGKTPGANLELNYSTYIFKLVQGLKQRLTAQGLHPQIRAGKNIPFTYFIYSPFIIGKKLSKEDEAHIKRAGIILKYLKNPKQLQKELSGTEVSKS